MLAFYHGGWSKEQIEAMREAVYGALFSIMQASGCLIKEFNWNCNDCHYKKPCKDFFLLKYYLEDAVENSVETVQN